MNEDKMIQTILELKDDVQDIRETMATKADFRNMQTTMDEILVVVKKTDQEITFLDNRLTRMEETHKSDMWQIKPLVGLA